jgi:hypothetical protein
VAQLDVSSALESLDLLALAENRTRPDRASAGLDLAPRSSTKSSTSWIR